MGKKIKKTIVALFFFASVWAHAELGQVNVLQLAPNFPLAAVVKSVFCIKEVGHKGFDQTCATASMVHELGLIVTAAHVVSHHGDRDFEIVNSQGQSFRVQTVWISQTYNPNADFLRDPQKLMMAEARMRFSGEGFHQQPIFDEIEPGVFSQADIALLKVIPEDLPGLVATGASPLQLRTKTPLLPGDRLLLAGFTWTHYAPNYLDAISKQMAATAGTGNVTLHNTNGRFSILAGRYSSTRGELIITRATPAQEKGEDPGTDAIDSYNGSSGAPILDVNGLVVGFHSASDSSLGQFAMVRKSMVELSTSAANLQVGFSALLVSTTPKPWARGEQK